MDNLCLIFFVHPLDELIEPLEAFEKSTGFKKEDPKADVWFHGDIQFVEVILKFSVPLLMFDIF